MWNKILKYAKSAGMYFAASLVPTLILALVNPWIAKNMSPADYAVSGFYSSFASLLSPVVIFYMINFYNKRYYEVSHEERLRLKALLFKALIYFSFAVSILCLGGLLVYMLFFHKGENIPLYPYIALMVFSIPLTGVFRLEQAEFKMSRNPKGFFKLTMASGLILVATNLLFVVAVKWGALGKMLAPMVTNLAVFVYLIIRHRSLFKIHNELREFAPVLKFCYPLALTAMFGYFFNGYDRTFLESLGNLDEFGLYVVGAQFAGYLVTVSTAVTSTFQPDIYESIAKHDRKLFWRSSMAQVATMAVVVALFILFCPLIVRILTAGRYVDATPYARIISISTLTSTTYFIINNYTIAKGHNFIYLFTTAVGAALTVLGYPLVTRLWSYEGGAWMVSLSYVALALVNLAFLLGNRLLKSR